MASFPVNLHGLDTTGLLPKISASPKATAPTQLSHAAKEFESILLTQWLQAAESSFGSVPGDDNDQDAGGEQMKSFAVQALAKSFSDSGGIGLAKLVSKALDHAGKTPDVSSSGSPLVP